MYNFEKLSTAAELQFFVHNFFVNPDWKYFQNITCKNRHFTSHCNDFIGPSHFADVMSEVYLDAIPKTVALGLGDSVSQSNVSRLYFAIHLNSEVQIMTVSC